jgi:hypothetical protein
VYSAPRMTLPSGIKFYAVLNQNSIPTDVVSNEFHRQSKVQLAMKVTQNNVIMLEWCSDDDCTPLFPVNKAQWTDGIVAKMLGN